MRERGEPWLVRAGDLSVWTSVTSHTYLDLKTPGANLSLQWGTRHSTMLRDSLRLKINRTIWRGLWVWWMVAVLLTEDLNISVFWSCGSSQSVVRTIRTDSFVILTLPVLTPSRDTHTALLLTTSPTALQSYTRLLLSMIEYKTSCLLMPMCLSKLRGGEVHQSEQLCGLGSVRRDSPHTLHLFGSVIGGLIGNWEQYVYFMIISISQLYFLFIGDGNFTEEFQDLTFVKTSPRNVRFQCNDDYESGLIRFYMDLMY